MPTPHESHPTSPEPRLATLDYLAAVAKDWAISTFAAVKDSLADCVDGTSVAYKQEIVEIIGVEENDVVAEAAMVVRIPHLPPCLGRFWSVV